MAQTPGVRRSTLPHSSAVPSQGGSMTSPVARCQHDHVAICVGLMNGVDLHCKLAANGLWRQPGTRHMTMRGGKTS